MIPKTGRGRLAELSRIYGEIHPVSWLLQVAPKNIGDVIYSSRYRNALPAKVVATQPDGQEWIIEGQGRARYRFRLVPEARIVPNPLLVTTKIPDATPQIISKHALNDEQALLARVRYNRLIDLFLGIVAYSLQNHMRTSIKSIGQIEIDEIYVGVDSKGTQYVVPVQAKGGNDKLAIVQTQQDLDYCAAAFPHLVCRSVSAQFMSGDRIALFELRQEEGTIKVAAERHYRLVPAADIGPVDLEEYRRR